MINQPERTSWSSHNWELIHTYPQEPLMHMALDQVLLEEVNAGRRAPTLRIWEWASPAVVIGIFQSVKNEVDTNAANRHGINIVRRISGGGAMFNEPGHTITYSIYAPNSLVEGLSFSESYAEMDSIVLQSLKDLGINAWYQPLNDITSDAGKIGGAAQARRTNALLHHVMMAYNIDTNKMLEVLRIGREKLSDKGTKSAAKRVDPLRSQTGISREAIVQHIIKTFDNLLPLRKGEVTSAEYAAAQELIEQKFSLNEWLYKVP